MLKITLVSIMLTSTPTPGGYRPTRPSLTARLREFISLFHRYEGAPPTADEPANESAATHGAVLVIPALLRGDRQTRGLRAVLSHSGYAAFGWRLGLDLGPTPRLMAGPEARLLELAAAYGPVDLVGLSMGGIFCRWLAFRHPDRVRQVISVRSPFRAPLDSFWLPLRPLLKLWPIPGLAAMAEELERPLPVPGSYLYSGRDGIIAWESCLDVHRPQDCFAIDGTQVTIGSDPSVRAIVLERLGRHPGT
jgi:pimeloyl-ACP methyl ester carboxylesterase